MLWIPPGATQLRIVFSPLRLSSAKMMFRRTQQTLVLRAESKYVRGYVHLHMS